MEKTRVIATEEIRRYLMGSGRYLIEAQNLTIGTLKLCFREGRNLNTLLNKARGRGVNLIVYGVL